MLIRVSHNITKSAHKPIGFPDSSVAKESACNAGDLGLTPGLVRSPGEGKGYPLQYTVLYILYIVYICNILYIVYSIVYPLYSPWGCKELDMAERFSFTNQ